MKEKDKEEKNGIEITLGELTMLARNKNFNSAMEVKAPNRKHSYWLGRILDKITSLLKAYNKEQQDILDKYAKKDKDGNIQVLEIEMEDGTKVKDPSGRVDFGKNQKEAEKEFEDLNGEKETIPFNKIVIEDEDDLPNYSPAEWASLFLFIEFKE